MFLYNKEDLVALPFHFCSMFVFFIPISELFGNRMRKIFQPVAFISAITMTVAFYPSPASIISNVSASLFKSFGSFHSFMFHHAVILYTLLSLTLSSHSGRKLLQFPVQQPASYGNLPS